MNLPKRTALLIGLTLCFGPAAQAHDLYEITSVAYLHSNRIELFVEMEFPTGMKLAGQTTAHEVAVPKQFESALPHLRELAGSFFQLTAGNHVVLPLATNVELGVEDRLQLRVKFTSTPHRPLRFVARGLEVASNENPYGTTLTVLDMVNQKVLGQATLFAATPTAEFPPRLTESGEVVTAITTSVPSDAVPIATFQSASLLPTSETTSPTRMPNWWLPLVTLAAVIVVAFAFCRRRS